MTGQGKAGGDAVASEFARGAAKRSSGPIGEFLYFFRRTRKFWMVPVVLLLLFAGFVLVTGGTAIAPLIYTIF